MTAHFMYVYSLSLFSAKRDQSKVTHAYNRHAIQVMIILSWRFQGILLKFNIQRSWVKSIVP